MDKWLDNKKLPYHLISACGLVCKDGLVLVIRNPRRGWEMPGGTVEQGETITDALKREIYEESGIRCEPERLTGIYQNLVSKDGYGPLDGMRIPPIINLAFICRYIDGKESISEESEDVRWVTPEEATGMVTHPLYARRLTDMLKEDGSIVFSSYEYDNKTAVFRAEEYM